MLGMQEVVGSIPIISTSYSFQSATWGGNAKASKVKPSSLAEGFLIGMANNRWYENPDNCLMHIDEFSVARGGGHG